MPAEDTGGVYIKSLSCYTYRCTVAWDNTQCTLWNTSVLDPGLVDLNGVILEVEENDAGTNAELLLSFLMDSLLEIGIEPENLEKER